MIEAYSSIRCLCNQGTIQPAIIVLYDSITQPAHHMGGRRHVALLV